MSAFFQWLYRLIFSRKESIQRGSDVIVQIPPQETGTEQLLSDNVPEKPPVISIDNTSQEIESICHQIEQAIEKISANIRANNDHAARQTLQQLITKLDHLMTCPQHLDSK